jgi:hypothetical protein
MKIGGEIVGVNNKYRKIEPRRKPFKSAVVKTVLFVLGRGFQSIAKRDPEVNKEVDGWAEGFQIMFEILPAGPFMTLQKQDGRLRYCGLIKTAADLVIDFKNVDTAFMMFTAQMSTAQAYAQHRLSVQGDIVNAMSMIRCLNMVEFYLFPGIIAKLILKRMPKMTLRKFGVRLNTYLLGIPFGI